MKPGHFKTLFVSDVHLGTAGCKADLLVEFLREYNAEKIYLIGDIVDGWRLKRGWYWPQSHNDVVQKLLRKARKGTQVVYITGNHDEFLRGFLGTHFGGVEVRDRDIHQTVDGRKLLVIHGDQFDIVVRNAKWLAHLGERAYTAALGANVLVDMVRRRFGFPYWSLSNWAKLKVKGAVNYIGEFEQVLASEARRVGANGVVCGHIHHAVIGVRDGIEYINTGDWVESCTAAAERHDGRIELIHWAAVKAQKAVRNSMALLEPKMPGMADENRNPAEAA